MKTIFIISFILFLTGCKSDRTADLKEKESSDSTAENDQAADKSRNNFYDFFYKFLSDEGFRKNRVKREMMIDEKFFAELDYTVHIYDSDSVETLEFYKDVTNKKVYSVIPASGNKAVNFIFLKEKNLWFLDSKDTRDLKVNSYKNFIPFLIKFSKDSVYQKKHIKYPLKSSFLNYDTYEDSTVYLPEKDVLTMNFFRDDYFSFLHNGDILNKEYESSTILIRGIGSGIYYEYKFKFMTGEWFLIEEIDFST